MYERRNINRVNNLKNDANLNIKEIDMCNDGEIPNYNLTLLHVITQINTSPMRTFRVQRTIANWPLYGLTRYFIPPLQFTCIAPIATNILVAHMTI